MLGNGVCAKGTIMVYETSKSVFVVDEDEFVRDALKTLAFLQKPIEDETLLGAVQRVIG